MKIMTILRRYPISLYLKAIISHKDLQRNLEHNENLVGIYKKGIKMLEETLTNTREALQVSKESLRAVLLENAELKDRLNKPKEFHIYHYLGKEQSDENNNI